MVALALAAVDDLKAEYERLCATPSDIYLHLPRFVALVEALDARHVIELGTRSGVSTIAWLYALAATNGRLTSVDIDPRPDIGDWPHWGFVQGDDLDPAVVSALDPADIVFIDTSHVYEHTARELRVYRHLLKPGGLIVCHDTMLERPIGASARPRFPVWVAVEEFCGEEGFEVAYVEECWGLAVIRCRW
jgi:predicted O-methyltransferase YrrM